MIAFSLGGSPILISGEREASYLRECLEDENWCTLCGPYLVQKYREALAMINPTSYWFTVDELDNAAAAELQPADPALHTEDSVETEEQKRDRLWRAVVDAAKGNG